MKRGVLLILCLLTLVSASAWSAGNRIPVAVSPGAGSGFQHVADACTTFSWAGVEGAKGYMLAVYEVIESGQLGRSVLRQDLPPGAFSWTVPASHCLSRGMTYAWSVGAVGGKTEVAWSGPVLFRVASGPSEAEFEEAVAVVKEYLRNQGEQSDYAPGDESTSLFAGDGTPLARSEAPEKTPGNAEAVPVGN